MRTIFLMGHKKAELAFSYGSRGSIGWCALATVAMKNTGAGIHYIFGNVACSTLGISQQADRWRSAHKMNGNLWTAEEFVFSQRARFHLATIYQLDWIRVRSSSEKNSFDSLRNELRSLCEMPLLVTHCRLIKPSQWINNSFRASSRYSDHLIQPIFMVPCEERRQPTTFLEHYLLPRTARKLDKQHRIAFMHWPKENH